MSQGTFRRVLIGWMSVFTVLVVIYGVLIRNAQNDARKDRIRNDTALRNQTIDTAISIKALSDLQNNALKKGELLVCNKALGTISAILSLSIAQSKQKLTTEEKAYLKQYFALTDPKQCPALVSPPLKVTANKCIAVGPFQDRKCTPGALNPLVTQSTIKTTICVVGWTATIRPPSSITGPEKIASMKQYGDGTDTSKYEYDHLISLELGGAPNDNKNLWPEPHSALVGSTQYGSFTKDKVENALKYAVCGGKLTLAAAQEIISVNWTRGLKYTSSHIPALPDPKVKP